MICSVANPSWLELLQLMSITLYSGRYKCRDVSTMWNHCHRGRMRFYGGAARCEAYLTGWRTAHPDMAANPIRAHHVRGATA